MKDENTIAQTNIDDTRELKKNERRYHNLLLNLDVGIVVHAPDTSIIMSNSKASELLGLDIEEMIGKKVSYLGWNFLNEKGDKLSKILYISLTIKTKPMQIILDYLFLVFLKLQEKT